MATWTKIERPIEDGRVVSMQAPVIVSASRSTDIPAFYAGKGIPLGRTHSMA